VNSVKGEEPAGGWLGKKKNISRSIVRSVAVESPSPRRRLYRWFPLLCYRSVATTYIESLDLFFCSWVLLFFFLCYFCILLVPDKGIQSSASLAEFQSQSPWSSPIGAVGRWLWLTHLKSHPPTRICGEQPILSPKTLQLIQNWRGLQSSVSV